MELGGGGCFETFIEGSVDHINYRDYIVSRRSFIYCSLATASLVSISEGTVEASAQSDVP